MAGRWCADEGYIERKAGSEDAAHLAVFLASDDSSFITGASLAIDGGYTAL